MKQDNVNQMDIVNGEDAAAKLEARKAKKREAAAQYKEQKAKEKEDRIKGGKAIIEEMKSKNIFDKLSDAAKDFLNSLANPAPAANNVSLFTQLFGVNPKVGTSFTLTEAFTKTLKGKSNIDHYVGKWAKKGTIVTFKQDKENILNSTYTLEAIGTGTADADDAE